MPEDKRAAMTEVATADGFKDLEEWSVVGSSIAMSYTYALQGKKPGELSKAISMHLRGQGRPQAQLRAERSADCAIGGFWAEAW